MLGFLKKYAPEDFYVWLEFFFKLAGLYQPQNKKRNKLYLLLAASNLFICLTVYTVLEWYTLIRDFDKDFKITMRNLFAATGGLIAICRVYYWFFAGHKFSEIQSIVQRKSFEFGCFNIKNVRRNKYFNVAKRMEQKGQTLGYQELKKLWETVDVTLGNESNEVDIYREDTMARARLLSCLIFTGMTVGCMFIYTASCVAVDVHEEYNEKHNRTVTIRTYPAMVSLNFDIPFLDGWYLGLFVLYCNCIRTFGFFPPSVIVTGTILHLLGQTMVIGKAFAYVDKNIDLNQDPDTVVLIKKIRIVKCIGELQEIHRAMNLLENFCSLQLLFEYGALTFLFCSSWCALIMVTSTKEWICLGLVQLTSFSEIFFMTYLCDSLSHELQNILKPVYALNWLTYPADVRRNLIALMHRLQKRDILTAGKMMNLDLSFCMQVIQTAYSVYTIMSKMKN